jgi:hypothetical protein
MSDTAPANRIEGLAEAIRAQGRSLAIMIGAQKLHNEMLAQVLEAVTKESDGALGKLLAKLAAESVEHTKKLDLIIERVVTGT